MSCPPKSALTNFFNLWLSPFLATLDPLIVLACFSFCHFFHISCNDICWQPHTIPYDASLLPLFCSLLFVHGFKFFTVFPFFRQRMKTRCVLQRCVHLLSFLLDCAGSTLRTPPPSTIAPSFAGSSAFFSAFSDEFFEERDLQNFLLGAVDFEVLDFQQYSFLKICAFLPVSRSTSRRPSLLGQCTSFHTSPQPINNRFVVIRNSCRTDSFLEKTPEGRLLRSFGSALHHELGIQRSVHPVNRPHLVVIDLHQLPPTRTTSTRNTPSREPSVVTWSRKPSAAIHQLCTFPIHTYGPSSGLFLQ